MENPQKPEDGGISIVGEMGPALKRTGLDGVFFTSLAEKPTYALVEVRDASQYWGMPYGAVEETFQAVHGKGAQSTVIGPRGERVFLYHPYLKRLTLRVPNQVLHQADWTGSLPHRHAGRWKDDSIGEKAFTGFLLRGESTLGIEKPTYIWPGQSPNCHPEGLICC